MSIDRVLFVDDLHGWAKGHFVNYADPNDIHIDQVLFRTTDGGVNWAQCEVKDHPDVGSLFFVDSNKGWATKTGARGILLHTSDGGDSWNEQYTGTDAYLEIITFADALYGWAVGDGATVVATTDGGKSWIEVHPTNPCHRRRRFVRAAVFHDHLNGWIIGESPGRDMILKTVARRGPNTSPAPWRISPISSSIRREKPG